MSETTKTKAEQHIEALMSQLAPESPRYQALASARDFKSSWVSLGAQLQGVRQGQLYNEWGYASFDDYCLKEIRIKRPTALKLTNAYQFLEHQEPQLLKQQSEQETFPDYRAVDLLRQAQQEAGFGDEDYQQLRDAVIEQGRSLPTVRQHFNQVTRSAESSEDGVRRSLQAALAAVRRLQNALQPLPEIAAPQQGHLTELETQLQQELATAEGEQAPTAD